jgi:hypothetical protein
LTPISKKRWNFCSLNQFGHGKKKAGNKTAMEKLNRNQRGHEGREDPKKNGYVDGIRRSMTNQGLTDEDLWIRELQPLK